MAIFILSVISSPSSRSTWLTPWLSAAGADFVELEELVEDVILEVLVELDVVAFACSFKSVGLHLAIHLREQVGP